MNKCTGFLLSYLRYREMDAIINCFTNEEGFKSFFIRNIYAPKSKKKAYLAPLYFLNIGFCDQKKSSLSLVKSIEFSFIDEKSDAGSYGISFFIGEVLDILLRGEGKNPVIFSEIRLLKSEMEKRNHCAHIIFLFRLMIPLGISPLLSEGKFLIPEQGVFSDVQRHRLFEESHSDLWKKILNTKSYEMKLALAEKRKLLNSLMVYYKAHIHHFKTPNSLSILSQVFS